MRRDGSARPALDQDPVARIPIELLSERGVTLGIVRVYAALRRRVGFEPAAENYLVSWPSITTISRDAGVSVRAVVRAAAWLDARDYLVIDRGRGPGGVNLYRVIAWRTWFRDLGVREGRHEAIRAFDARRAALGDLSRRGQAEAAALLRPDAPPRWLARSEDPGNRQVAREMSRNARQTLAPGQKCHARHPPAESVSRRAHGACPGWPLGGDAGDTRSVDQLIRVSENRGAADAAPAHALEDQQKEQKSPSDSAVATLSRAGKRMPAAKPMTPEEYETRIRELRLMTQGWKES
jgi:hypothetical protein